MNVPLSSQKVVLKSLSRKAWRELEKLRKEVVRLSTKADGGDADALQELRDFDGDLKREDLILAMYPDLKNPDDLTQRDVNILCDATERYSRGVPEATIKNLWASGTGTTAQTENS